MRIRAVLAPNPGLFTLGGTNTWIVGEPPAIVIDPGPDDSRHLGAVVREAQAVAAILLTHDHPDHALGAPALAAMTGAPVRAFRGVPEPQRLRDGDVIECGGARLRIVHTPGHTWDHVCFATDPGGPLFTGDTVLGRGTSVLDPPEGDLAAYLRSLGRLVALDPGILYPGHGPVVGEGGARLREYIEHRQERERQVLAALEAGATDVAAIVERVYVAYPPDLHPVAARSVLAHLVKLEADGRVRRVAGDAEERFALRP